jgi:hypothetical protein
MQIRCPFCSFPSFFTSLSLCFRPTFPPRGPSYLIDKSCQLDLTICDVRSSILLPFSIKSIKAH